ncbi:MAG: SAM-dependent methyltransferase [Lachnospiraceae bacterium]|nr:SAM-dependent methyltransferase [Lachnospiraceae bacterium]
MVQLSKRLQALADMVSSGRRVADVGCDHGFVSIYLVQKGISPKVYAMDVRKGPLDRAKEHIAAYRLEEQIETRLSDGLTAMQPGEADALVCAGMGGPLMIKILTEGAEVTSKMKELILQPQSEIEEFRRFLRTAQWSIVEEKMILEEGKFYPMMKVHKLKEDEAAQNQRQPLDVSLEVWQRLENKFGPLLLEAKDETLKQYLEFQLHICVEILEHLKEGSSDKIESKRAEVLAEMEDIRLAMKYM